MYDLAGANENRRFSPYCWRIRMALAHKGLDVECIPWRFTEKDKIKFSGQERVQVLMDGNNTVADSEVLFIKFWAETVLHPEMLQILVLDMHNNLRPEDQSYFRESREKMIGKSLEEVVA